MINKTLQNIRKLVSYFPLLKGFLRMFIDRRYFYHNFQGMFTTYKVRDQLKKIELLFYRKRVNHYKNSSKPLLPDIEKLFTEGIIENPIQLDSTTTDEIRDYLTNKLCHDPEVKDSRYFQISEATSDIKRAYYMCEDVVKAPHVMDIANNNLIIDYVSEYFGALPSIDYIGAWWSLPSDKPSLTQSFHRDIDTLHSMKFFIYLTEVNQFSGPHVYIKGSSKSDVNFSKDKMYGDEEIDKFYDSNKAKSLIGPKGYCFLADTFGLHKGLPPTQSPRLILQVIYSLKQTPFGPKKPFLDFDESLFQDLSVSAARLVNSKIIKKSF